MIPSNPRDPPRKSTLGRGLSSLIPDTVLHPPIPGGGAGPRLVTVPLDQVRRNPQQPRTELEGGLDALADSIRQHGLLQPIVVREEEGHFVLIAGERRWRASGMAGLTEVPVLVTGKAATEQDQLVLALVENLLREDLDPVEQAMAFQRLVGEHHLKQEEVGHLVGLDRSTVNNMLRLLRLPDEALSALHDGRISTGHAKVLLALTNPARVPSALQTIIDNGMSVRGAERMVQALNAAGTKVRRASTLPVAVRHAADQLSRSLGARVDIRPSAKGGGTITIRYGGDEELTSLVDRLQVEKEP